MRHRLPLIAVCLLLLPARPMPAQEVLALQGARVETVSSEPLEEATILIREGKIEAVGTELDLPEEARVIEAKGMTVTPGWIAPWTTRGVPSKPSGGAPDHAEQHLADLIDPFDGTYETVCRSGYLILGVGSRQGGVAGIGAVLTPGLPELRRAFLERDGFLQFTVVPNTSRLDKIRNALKAARQQLEEEKKKEAEGKKEETEEESQEKETEKTADVKKQRAEVWKSVLRGELRTIVSCASGAAVLHFLQLYRNYEKTPWKPILLLGGDAYRAVSPIAESGLTVLLSPTITFLPYSRARVNPTRRFHEASVPIAFVPEGESDTSLERTRSRLGLLVRWGLPRSTALSGVTLQPATVLGLGERYGTIEPGKQADLVVFSGDPFDPRTRIEMVLRDGELVFERPKR